MNPSGDPDGFITQFNKPYGWFLGMDPEAQILKHCYPLSVLPLHIPPHAAVQKKAEIRSGFNGNPQKKS